MTGPSAMGSENGRPSSMTSAPASCRPWIKSIVADASGCPAVMYGTRARFPDCFRAANAEAIRFRVSRAASDEVVANPDAIAFRILGLDDRANEDAVGVAVRE